MDTLEKLKSRQQERTALLNRAIALAHSDPYVCAAWLFGSGHRDNADAFSDIDLWMVVDDAHIEAIVTERHAYITQIGQPLLALDVPGNAPVGGGYLMLQYPGAYGPLQVDWYWQPRAKAAIPDDARLLFDHCGLNRNVGSQSTDFSYLTQRLMPPAANPDRTTALKVLYELTFCWCMALIGAKKVARREAESAGWLLQLAAEKLHKAQALLPALKLPALTPAPIEPTTITLPEAMALLRQIQQGATELASHLDALGEPLSAQLVPSINAFMDLAEAACALDNASGLVRRRDDT